MEDLHWKQRAKFNWFKNGDHNTRFFHAWTTQRKMNNFIGAIKDEEGRDWSGQVDVGRVFTEYFQRLFSSDGSVSIQECLSTISSKVTHEMNAGLTRPYTPEEVDFALRQMQPMKEPRPDSYGACFFQQHW